MIKKKLIKLFRNPEAFFLDAITKRLNSRLETLIQSNLSTSKISNTKTSIALGWMQEHLTAVSSLHYELVKSDELASCAPKVHIITDIPFWRNSLGNQKRIYELTKALIDYNITIVFNNRLTFYDAKVLSERLPGVKLFSTFQLQNALTVEADPKLISENTKQKLQHVYENFCEYESPDVVICEYITQAYLCRHLPKKTLKFLDTHDVMWRRQKTYEENGRTHHINISKSEETRIFDSFDVVIAIQKNEAKMISEMTRKVDIITCYHPIEDICLSKGRPAKRVVYIAGSNPANVDSINWFIETVWTHIHDPEAELHIYGSICSAIKSTTKNKKNIFLHDVIDDTREVYAVADIVVNPVLYGGGLKIKTVEALSHGLPLITTAAGAEGLEDLQHNAFFKEDSPINFRAKLNLLLNDPNERKRLSHSAMKLREIGFSKESCFASLHEMIERQGMERPQTKLPLTTQVATESVKICEKLLVVSNKNFALADGIKAYFDQYAFVKFSSTSDIPLSNLGNFLKYNCIDRVFFFNPFSNPSSQNMYNALRKIDFPIICFDRGALPDSWFFDPNGFNFDSSSYKNSNWKDRIDTKQREHAQRYISKLVKGLNFLENQSISRGTSILKEKYGLLGKKVIFIPLQRPNDAVIRQFSDPCGGFSGFLGIINSLSRELGEDEFVLVAKKHPLEAYRPKINVLYVDDNENIHDLIAASDVVITINSGVGLLALCHGKQTICCGESFYQGDGLAIHSADPAHILSLLRDTDLELPKRNLVLDFIAFLTNDFYSFGKSESHLRTEKDGSLSRITTRIDFDSIKNFGVDVASTVDMGDRD